MPWKSFFSSLSKKSMDVSFLCSKHNRPFIPSFVPPRQRRIAISSTRSRGPRKAGAFPPRTVTLMKQSSSSPPVPPGDALVLVPGDGVDNPARWLAPFSAALDRERSVWLWFGGALELGREREREREVSRFRGFLRFSTHLDLRQKQKTRKQTSRPRPPCPTPYSPLSPPRALPRPVQGSPWPISFP